jgi:hypothetical protein
LANGVGFVAVGLIQFPVVPHRGATGHLHMHLHQIPLSKNFGPEDRVSQAGHSVLLRIEVSMLFSCVERTLIWVDCGDRFRGFFWKAARIGEYK